MLRVLLCISGSLVIAIPISFVIFDRLKKGRRSLNCLMVPLKGEGALDDLSHAAKALMSEGLTDILLIGVDCGLSPEQADLVQSVADRADNIRIIKANNLRDFSEDSDGKSEKTVGDN